MCLRDLFCHRQHGRIAGDRTSDHVRKDVRDTVIKFKLSDLDKRLRIDSVLSHGETPRGREPVEKWESEWHLLTCFCGFRSVKLMNQHPASYRRIWLLSNGHDID